MSEALLSRLKRFCLTGLASTGVHVLVAFLCIEAIGLEPPLANATASLVATVFAYVAHTLWSFSSQLQKANLFRFAVVSGASCALAAAVAKFAELCGWHYWVGIALVVCVVPALSFLAHHFWTYRQQ